MKDTLVSDAELGRASFALTYGLIAMFIRDGIIKQEAAIALVAAARNSLVDFPASEPRGDLAVLDTLLVSLSGKEPPSPTWTPRVVPGGKA